MGIYIKGMDVPAIVKVHYGPNGKRYIEDPFSREWREMVSVPDHGDLIDRDALLDAWDDNHTIPSAAAKVIEKIVIPADKEKENDSR